MHFGQPLSTTTPGQTDNGPSSSSSQHKHKTSTSSSSDFGDFQAAPAHTTSPSRHHHPTRLDDNDLLGSFDDIDEMQPPMSAPPFTLHQGVDMFDDDATPVGTPPAAGQPLRRLTSRSSLGVGAAGSPTKSRYWSSDFPGPSSPPRVTDAHIMVHAPHNGKGEDAASEFRRLRRLSDEYTVSGKLPPAAPRNSRSPSRSRTSIADVFSSHRPTSLVDALATSRIATKWKRSVLNNTHVGGEDGPTKTSVPIDVTHKSPFATQNQITGSYSAPEGAPGFVPTSTVGLHDEEEDEYANTNLVGRGEMTEPVLQVSHAKELRALLPARQRISDSWNLLFSLDQHGASLSTLYRQTEKYAKTHRTGGNVLAVKDSEGHVFGIFLNEPIMKREGTYYGSGESFMFKFEAGQSKPRVFRWTGRNQYIALCESGFISFGGGGNSYGLILDSSFSRNTSATSPAFENDILCGEGSTRSDKGVPFDCIGLEVWGTA